MVLSGVQIDHALFGRYWSHRLIIIYFVFKKSSETMRPTIQMSDIIIGLVSLLFEYEIKNIFLSLMYIAIGFADYTLIWSPEFNNHVHLVQIGLIR